LSSLLALKGFMKIKCPKCEVQRPNISKNGFFKRKSDSKIIQRYFCKACKLEFSTATFSDYYYQKKRRLNFFIRKDLCSSTSMRRIALNYKISRTTVKRKVDFLAFQANIKHNQWLKEQNFKTVEFDDLETFELTKCKPISISMAVESNTRKIIDFKVSSIGAKGRLTSVAFKKYGKRKNESYKNRKKLFKELKSVVSSEALFKTDMHKDYKRLIKNHFPKAEHRAYKSVRSSLTGQGELKRTQFDPIFSVNHVFAMLRDNIKRLSRKTWCTTKKLEELDKHVRIYVDFHNSVLI
jgi:transposase-like protein/IS1 family transposase